MFMCHLNFLFDPPWSSTTSVQVKNRISILFLLSSQGYKMYAASLEHKKGGTWMCSTHCILFSMSNISIQTNDNHIFQSKLKKNYKRSLDTIQKQKILSIISEIKEESYSCQGRAKVSKNQPVVDTHYTVLLDCSIWTSGHKISNLCIFLLFWPCDRQHQSLDSWI